MACEANIAVWQVAWEPCSCTNAAGSTKYSHDALRRCTRCSAATRICYLSLGVSTSRQLQRFPPSITQTPGGRDTLCEYFCVRRWTDETHPGPVGREPKHIVISTVPGVAAHGCRCSSVARLAIRCLLAGVCACSECPFFVRKVSDWAIGSGQSTISACEPPTTSLTPAQQKSHSQSVSNLSVNTTNAGSQTLRVSVKPYASAWPSRSMV